MDTSSDEKLTQLLSVNIMLALILYGAEAKGWGNKSADEKTNKVQKWANESAVMFMNSLKSAGYTIVKTEEPVSV